MIPGRGARRLMRATAARHRRRADLAPWPALGQKGSQTCALLNQLGVRYFSELEDATASEARSRHRPLRWGRAPD